MEENMATIPFIDTTATGQNIDFLRKKAGMTVKDMQTAFGFATPQAVYKWIHGTTMPTVDNLIALAFLFDVKIDDIIVTKTEGRISA